ncbi:phage portal protein [Marinilactibacillus sp. 15R]|uniref:phage portal protein n=1 Tax=Marinilactibacillus sp. 15R TaxID=1911586 RepID=UPI00090976E5|nr:phage portal protein [Marinilactibacillus sp. 15R]API89426.1 phage portal protein [Marinilactibacillus sp. 15R]
MNIFQRAVNRITPKFVKQAVLEGGTNDNRFSSWLGKTFFGFENGTLETNENIFSIVSRLSNTLSSLPFKKYKKYDQQFDEQMDRLIYYPNSNQTLDSILNVMEVSRNTNGNGYALIFRDVRGAFEKLVPLVPINVEPVIEGNSGELWYQVRNGGKNFFFHNSDIIHVRHITGSGNWKGISPIAVLKGSNDFDKAVREFSLKEMMSLRDSFILTYQSNIDEKKRDAVVEDFRRFYEENGGVLFQEPGVEIDKMDRKFVAGDMQIAESVTRDRIANVYNVPGVFLNKGSESFSSNEQLMQLFVNMTLAPIVKQYEREFNKKLLTSKERVQGFYFKFNLNALLRGDSTSRQQFYHGALRDGWMSRDEVRRLEELPPRGNQADELWISGDMYPLEMDPILRKSGGKPDSKDEI